jgi:hypothetical protein
MRKSSFALLILFSLLAMGFGCASRKTITPNGVFALKMGEALPVEGTARLKGHAVRDTFVEDGDFQWRQVVMEYKKGNVYLEEDFFGSGSLARVRVYTPEFVVRGGLRVGKTAADLKAKASDWTIAPMPKFNLLDLYSRVFPHIHFVVDDPSVPQDKEWSEYKLDQIDPNAKIVAIVVL